MPSWCRRSVTGGLAGPFKRSAGCARHRFVDTVTTVSYEYSGSIYTIMMHSKQTSVSGCKWQGGRQYAGPTFKTSHPADIRFGAEDASSLRMSSRSFGGWSFKTVLHAAPDSLVTSTSWHAFSFTFNGKEVRNFQISVDFQPRR